MTKLFFTYLCIPLLAAGLSFGTVHAAEGDRADLSPQWDSAVSSWLLAAGMYGLDIKTDKGATPSLSSATNQFKTLPAELTDLDTNNITLSYSGSSGRLDFSAGYIYTSVKDNQEPDTLLVGLGEPDKEVNLNSSTPNNSWYLSLDYSKAFQVNENFAVAIGSRAMLIKNPFDAQDGRILSMLLNLPVSYKNYFTLTPELQWSRTLPGSSIIDTKYSKPTAEDNKDVFYGGMSISFSY